MFIFRSVTYWLTLLFLVLIGIASAVSWVWVVPPLKDRLVQQKFNSLTAATSTSFYSHIAGVSRPPWAVRSSGTSCRYRAACLSRASMLSSMHG